MKMKLKITMLVIYLKFVTVEDEYRHICSFKYQIHLNIDSDDTNSISMLIDNEGEKFKKFFTLDETYRPCMQNYRSLQQHLYSQHSLPRHKYNLPTYSNTHSSTNKGRLQESSTAQQQSRINKVLLP